MYKLQWSRVMNNKQSEYESYYSLIQGKIFK
jgi:hypothetical protein